MTVPASTPVFEGELTDAQRELRARVRDYVETTVVPARARLDAVESGDDMPWDVLAPGADLGLRALPLPAALGGQDAGMDTLCLVAEELAAGDLGVCYYFKHYWRFARLLPRLPERIRDRVLDGIRNDLRFVPASAMTEFDAGSDNNLPYDAPGAGAMLSATREADAWVLNGAKCMITNGSVASLYFVFARTDPSAGVTHGLTSFAVTADAPGISYGPPYRKLGQRGSIQTDVHFDNCRIPHDAQLSELGEGLAVSRRALVGANITNAAMAVGIARAAYEEAVRHSTERIQGGVPIFQHQLVAHELGAMRVALEAARSFTWQTARAYLDFPSFDVNLASAANAFATEMAMTVTRQAMELFGGRGIMSAWPVEKFVRDALTLPHANGTNALLRLAIGTADAERVAGAATAVNGAPRRGADGDAARRANATSTEAAGG